MRRLGVLVALSFASWAAAAPPGPFDRQVAENLDRLGSDLPAVRAAGAERLGLMRAYAAEEALLARIDDPAPEVRRQVVMALAWTGGRAAVGPLVERLADPDWVVRQAAHAALTNLTGMEWPFDAMAEPAARAAQADRWRSWWVRVPANRPPEEALAVLERAARRADGGPVTASSTYKGPPEAIIDGRLGPAFWQTKEVPFPQWCTVDLGRESKVSRVVVHQYGPAFVMTDYELATSLDGETFESILRRREESQVALSIEFDPQPARYVRIISHAAKNPTYPTTFFEVEVDGLEGSLLDRWRASYWEQERAARALGALGGRGASRALIDYLGDNPPDTPPQRPAIRAAIRALGRLGDEESLGALVGLLGSTMWARHAADALGDVGDRRAVAPLLAAYPRYAKQLNLANPPDVPADDRMGFPDQDRMLETPYAIAYALSRLPLDDPDDICLLRVLAPRIMANLPNDHDTFVLYEPEVHHLLTRHLLEAAGLRQQAAEHAFEQFGQPRRVARADDEPQWPNYPAWHMASWLPALCTEPEDVERLAALLEHRDGWVRLNAAKTLGWLGDRRAVEPLAAALAGAKAEADYGFDPTFKHEEFNDPAPRWREALVRALGQLAAHEHTGMIVAVLDDERSVLDVRHAAAEALAELGSDEAVVALQRAAVEHPFLSVRHRARDALVAAGGPRAVAARRFLSAPRESATVEREAACGADGATVSGASAGEAATGAAWSFDDLQAIVFLKGDNDLPNTHGTVEQTDRWRQTYVVTDPGPAYRPGRNIYILAPPRPDGKATPVTRFDDGYVAEPELSWEADHLLFARRGEDDPWWHVYRVNLDGSGLRQLTFGPYHHVSPMYLPDGRIVVATSRLGIRDEYHGYPCTSLFVMQPDGSAMEPISVNIGRDNEPALLHDGRLVFSRLEVFYSRNKTELTLQAAYPDGTRNVVLYGPERRQFWRSLDHGPPGPDDGQEAPLTHRVLRMTQPRPMPDGRHIVVSTQAGLVLVGPSRRSEQFISPDFKRRAYTTPYPLPDGTILCASTWKVPDRAEIDLGLYRLDPSTGELELIYNDPATADYEPRAVMRRRRPPVLVEHVRRGAYAGRFVCSTVFATQEAEVAERGRFVRLVEGVPVVARHSTQTNPWEVWKNHGGTHARILGTAPLAPDGSFHVEAPADRLMHFQVLDSDRRVVGNQLTWIYTRPGEAKSCVGCHEDPHTAPPKQPPLAALHPPLDFTPAGHEFTYRAKAWFKGHLPPEIEERTRTVRAVNVLSR